MTVFPIDETHDPDRRSWVPGADGHADFPVQNLPFGIASLPGGAPRPAVAIGDQILDLAAAADLLPAGPYDAATLNPLMALPLADRLALRRRLSALLSDEAHRSAVAPFLRPAADHLLHLPAAIGDYSDFYVGIHHATNIGRQFRPDAPLLPNYKYVPIGYHGRASSIRASGVPVVRPNGQRKAPDAEAPAYGPTSKLDYELEMAVWIGRGNALGQPIPIGDAPRHVFGFGLLNDWSARDIQAWEYQPLGPFLAKNFQSTVSPWIVTAEALAPYRLPQPPRPDGDPRPLPYLWDDADQAGGALGVTLEALILTARMRASGSGPVRLSRGPATSMYWTIAQMLTHHAANGCNLMPGDLLGTGTISAPTRDGLGSLMELSLGGREPLALPDGETRSFVEDGDEIILRATARAEGRVAIGFGECRALVLPAVG